jgi:outer membrane receptor for ferrienterochelin and colicins
LKNPGIWEKRFFRSPGQYGYLSLNFSPSMLLNISFTGNYTGPMLVPYFGPLAANPETGQLNTSSSFLMQVLKSAMMCG